MTALRTTQLAVEVLDRHTPALRSGQLAVEVLSRHAPAVRSTQLAVEVLRPNTIVAGLGGTLGTLTFSGQAAVNVTADVVVRSGRPVVESPVAFGALTISATAASQRFAALDVTLGALTLDAQASAQAGGALFGFVDDGLTLTSTAAVTVGVIAQPTIGRNPLQQPFLESSIWNMPIGSGAVYVNAELPAAPGDGNQFAWCPAGDDERLFLDTTQPDTTIKYSSGGWSSSRCNADDELAPPLLDVQVPFPPSYVLDQTTHNECAAFLLRDGRTVRQVQPLAHCTVGGDVTAMAEYWPNDLLGDGALGAHGGSGLSALGGTLRIGELRPWDTTGPRHALKLDVWAAQCFVRPFVDGVPVRDMAFRWPAQWPDSYWDDEYGAEGAGGPLAMRMGALLAIPASVNLASLQGTLETEPARLLAWTLQNYGAYIVDDTHSPGYSLCVENSPAGDFKAQFEADWKFPFAQKMGTTTGIGATAWVRDFQKLMTALYVVDNNNDEASTGGGGTPRQPLAGPLGHAFTLETLRLTTSTTVAVKAQAGLLVGPLGGLASGSVAIVAGASVVMTGSALELLSLARTTPPPPRVRTVKVMSDNPPRRFVVLPEFRAFRADPDPRTEVVKC